MSSHSSYEIRLSTSTCPTDDELEQLLTGIYVGGGFTTADAALNRFAATAVRPRGDLLVAIECQTQKPVGMVIVVTPDSVARQFAKADEAEMHLLGVADEHRGKGLGLSLVDAAMNHAWLAGYVRMLLWTQPTMKPAHNLYRKVGFVREPARDFCRNGNEEFHFMFAELDRRRPFK